MVFIGMRAPLAIGLLCFLPLPAVSLTTANHVFGEENPWQLSFWNPLAVSARGDVYLGIDGGFSTTKSSGYLNLGLYQQQLEKEDLYFYLQSNQYKW